MILDRLLCSNWWELDLLDKEKYEANCGCTIKYRSREYMAMDNMICELLWLKHLLRQLKFLKIGIIELASINISPNPIIHKI